jgi:hypothetical protein
LARLAAARTLLMINSFTGPLAEARELIALLAGTGLTCSLTFRASGVVYALRISVALEFDTMT